MKQPTTENLFRDIVCDHFRVSPKQCSPETRFSEDLGADVNDRIELANAIEEEFGVFLTEQKIYGMDTYGKLLDFVKSKIAAKESNLSSGEDA